MDKNQRDYLRIRLTEVIRRTELKCRQHLDKQQPREVTEALELVQAWNESKTTSRDAFSEELYAHSDKAKQSILFGTKEEFDEWCKIIEGLDMPTVQMKRKVRRGSR